MDHLLARKLELEGHTKQAVQKLGCRQRRHAGDVEIRLLTDKRKNAAKIETNLITIKDLNDRVFPSPDFFRAAKAAILRRR
jgi:hypothetical protein